MPDGTQVKLGVFLANTKPRRAKLTADKLQRLADLGLDLGSGLDISAGYSRIRRRTAS
ncbi:helicase-associated [Streptomyces azureus]|uniref:Helicase-associated n=1 Tax=Streptomyces azureus TaxID=146537 RepID=A0A0K8PI31_STRAJ|nr:helicase-associated [Streptomyces azureus]